MATSELLLPNDSNKTTDITASEESKDIDTKPIITQQKEQKQSQGLYDLDTSWTQDIDHNDLHSFVKEYPKMKKLLQTFDLDPIKYTNDIISMV